MAEPQPENDPFPVFLAPVNPLTNDAPVKANPIRHQDLIADSTFRFTLPANTFADDAALLYSTGALPRWLDFDPATRTFSGIAPELNTAGVGFWPIHVIEVIATDGQYSVSDLLQIRVVPDFF